jgi:hypothetical protein
MAARRKTQTLQEEFKTLFGFDGEGDEYRVDKEKLQKENPWRTATAKSKKAGRGRAQGRNLFNSPISSELNKQRALANSLELQHKRTFG